MAIQELSLMDRLRSLIGLENYVDHEMKQKEITKDVQQTYFDAFVKKCDFKKMEDENDPGWVPDNYSSSKKSFQIANIWEKEESTNLEGSADLAGLDAVKERFKNDNPVIDTFCSMPSYEKCMIVAKKLNQTLLDPLGQFVCEDKFKVSVSPGSGGDKPWLNFKFNHISTSLGFVTDKNGNNLTK